MTINTQRTAWIACAADDEYALPLGVMLCSALQNASKNYNWKILCLDGGVCARNKRRLERVIERASVSSEIEFLSPDKRLLDNINIHGHLTQVTLFRLLAPRILENKTNRVIYFDCDLLVRKDISELWEKDFGGKPCLAVQGYGAPYVSDPLGVPTWQEQGMASDTPCLNAGVLVMNLTEWKSLDIPHRVIDYLKKRKDKLPLNDQLGLNAILAGNWGKLDPSWNRMNTIFRFDSWADSPFKDEIRPKLDLLLNDPGIIHYTGPSKPWIPHYVHPGGNEYINYLKNSGWFHNQIEYLLWFASKKLIYNKNIKKIIKFLFK